MAFIYGTATLTGTDADDELYGMETNDTLIGGKGNDLLVGRSGSDIYVFSKGNGQDTISERPANNTGKNTIRFTDVKSTDTLSFSMNGEGNVVINYGNNDKITVASNENMQMQFSDGVQRSMSQLITQKGITTAGSVNTFPTYINPSNYDYLYVVDHKDDSVRIAEGNTNYSVLVTIPDYKLDNSVDRSKVTYLNNSRELPYFIDALATREADNEIGNKKTITYSFVTQNTDNLQGFTLYTEAEKQAVRKALSAWESISGVSFIEQADSATVDTRFFRHNFPDEPLSVAGYAYYGGNVHIRNTYLINTDANAYDQVLVHEIGHTLGLKHPGNYGHDESGPFLPTTEDSTFYTIMSYESNWNHGNPALYEESGPRVLDVAAIQYLYGVNKNARTGDNVYTLKDKYIWDGAGNDTLDASAESYGVNINLEEGSWIHSGSKKSSLFSEGQAFIGFGTEIENAIGSSHDDRIVGNNKANTLNGKAGNDILSGKVGNDILNGEAGNDVLNGNAGADRMVGGAGNDVYYVDNKGDVVVETADGGRDTVSVSFDYDLLKVAHIENAVLLGTGNLTLQGNGEGNLLKGNAGDNHLKGLGGNDWLEGGAGNDILNGNAGADRMIGGAGDDVYYVDNKGDVVVETAGGRRDTVNVSFDYDLLKVAHIENAIAVGAGHIKLQGSGEGNLLKGNAGNNQLNGLGGNDGLDGGAGHDVLVGGSGRDVLVGGAGSDTFKFGSINDSTLALKDVIIDFNLTRGKDKIDLSAIDANTTQAGNQAFSFIGNTNFTAAGQVRFAGGVVSGDVNGDKVADFAIELKNVTKLLTSDFIL